MTREGLRAVGGIGGALERHAEQTLAALSREDGDAPHVVRLVLLALTTPQGTRTSRPAAQVVVETGHAFASRCIEVLEEARLLVREEGALTLAHEALLVHWTRVARWVASARDNRQLAGDVERDAAHWRATGDATLLWRKRRLAAAEGLGGAVRLSPDATSFVRAARSEERRGRLVVVAASALLAVGAASLVARSFVVGRREAAAAEENTRALSRAREELESSEARSRTEKASAEQAKTDAADAMRAAAEARTRCEADLAAPPNLEALCRARAANAAALALRSPEECRRCDAQKAECEGTCASDRLKTRGKDTPDDCKHHCRPEWYACRQKRCPGGGE